MSEYLPYSGIFANAILKKMCQNIFIMVIISKVRIIIIKTIKFILIIASESNRLEHTIEFGTILSRLYWQINLRAGRNMSRGI